MGQIRATRALMFTDIEASTRLLARVGDERYHDILSRHTDIAVDAIAAHRGTVHGGEGDSTFSSFPTALGAISAAVDLSVGLARHPWPADAEVRVRIGVHIGDVVVADDQLLGLQVHTAARIGAAGHGGQIVVSRRTLDLAGALPSELTVTPLGLHRLKDVEEELELVQVGHADLPGRFPPLRTLGTWSGLVPVPVTELVGRADELALVESLLSDRERLVTLLGAGGMGKSRLGIETALRTREIFDGRVAFVNLAAVTTHTQVIPAVASALAAPDATTASVLGVIGPAPCLLVLDNLEQIDDPAPALGELLDGTSIALLVTSQRATRHPNEVIVPVEPLPADEATELFVQRARRAGADVMRAEASVSGAVTRLCDELDGVPLAIELAAARLRTTPLTDLDSLITSLRSPTRPGGRHESVPATIGWTYDLLPAAAQRGLRVLGILDGPVSREGALRILDSDDAEQVLETLFDYSLLRVLPGGGIGMLDSVRSFARTRLEESGELSEASSARTCYVRTLAGEAAAGLQTSSQLRWLDRLDLESADILRAIDDLAASEPEAALEVLAQLGRYWTVRGRTDDVTSRLDRLIPDPLPADPVMTRAAWTRFTCRNPKLRDGLIQMVYEMVPEDAAREAAQILDAAERAGDRVSAARAAQVLMFPAAGFDKLGLGKRAAFQARAEKLVTEASDEVISVPKAFLNTPLRTMVFGWSRAATMALNREIEVAEAQGDLLRVAALLIERGRTASRDHRHDQLQGLTRALLVARELGDRQLEANALRRFASCAYNSPEEVLQEVDRYREVVTSEPELADVDEHLAIIDHILSLRGLEQPTQKSESGRLSTSHNAGLRLRVVLQDGVAQPNTRATLIGLGGLCWLLAAVMEGTTQWILLGAGGLGLAVQLFVARRWTVTGGPKAPWLFAVLALSCGAGRPGAGMAIALVVGAFPLGRGMPYRLAAILITVAGALAWAAGFEVGVLVAVLAKIPLRVVDLEEVPASIVRHVAARTAVVCGVVLVVDGLHRAGSLQSGLPATWVDVGAIAGPFAVLLTAVTIVRLASVFAALLVVLSGAAFVACFASLTIGLAIGGLGGIVAALVAVVGGRKLNLEFIEARRIEKLRAMPPLQPVVGSRPE